MKSRLLIAAGLVALACLIVAPTRTQEVTSENVEGVSNFHRLETVVACAGATKPEAAAEIKKMGFASIISLRQPSEAGADIEAEAAATKSAGIRFYNIPFNPAAPDPVAAGKFLDVITTKGVEPAFIHCSGGNRASMMWLIKRLVVDHWDVDRAEKEAAALGLSNPALKQFALDYAQSHKR